MTSFAREIEEAYVALNKLPNVREAGIARTRLYTRIRSLRMKLAKSQGTHTAAEWEQLKAQCGYRCAGCGNLEQVGAWLTKDHLVPISKGGSDAISNITPLCGRCNSRKGDRHGK